MLSPRQVVTSLTRRPLTTAGVLIANALPLIGVFWFGWDAYTVVVLYWIENVVVGVMTVLKMVSCNPIREQIAEWPPKVFGSEVLLPPGAGSDRVPGNSMWWFYVPFFSVHYAIFTLVHGFFITFMFSESNGFGDVGRLLGEPLFGWTVFALTVSYLLEFAIEYIWRDGRHKTVLPVLMMQPYGRIAVLHVAVLFGGLLTEGMGSPTWMLLVLIAAKTFGDLLGLAHTLPRDATEEDQE